MAKFLIIGKCDPSSNSGPANIMREIIRHYNCNDIELVPVLLTNNTSKISFVLNVVREIFCTKGSIVNVHTDGFLIPLLVYFMSLLKHNNKYFLTVHGIYKIDASMLGTEKKRYLVLEKYLYSHFPNLVCVSQMLQKDILKIYGREKNVFVIPNATDAVSKEKSTTDFYKLEPLQIVLLGGLRKQKGIFEVIKVLSYLKINGIKFKLHIYGPDENKLDQVEEQLRDRNMYEDVVYHGNVMDKQEIYDAVSKSDINMCLSLYDTFNVSIIESIVLGCPCICSKRCGAEYLIDSKNGLVVDVDNSNYKECILSYINDFYKNPDKRENIYRNSKQYIEELSWDNICKKYISLIK